MKGRPGERARGFVRGHGAMPTGAVSLLSKPWPPDDSLAEGDSAFANDIHRYRSTLRLSTQQTGLRRLPHSRSATYRWASLSEFIS